MAQPFVPQDELTLLKNEYINGRISMREVMDSVDLGPGATLDDYREIFDDLFDWWTTLEMNRTPVKDLQS